MTVDLSCLGKWMFRSLTMLLPTACTVPVAAQNHLENVIVELYYISDANDATDTIGGGLTEGSRTYRVFIDLDTTCSLRAIYGDTSHPILIESTAPFFNHLDRGRTYAHLVNNNAVEGEGTVALDSWLSLGAGSNQTFGVLKTEDPDGSNVGGTNNDGGSASIPGGLLVNDSSDAGIPITQMDGLVDVGMGSAVPPSFGLIGDDPSAVFKDSTIASAFLSSNMRIGCSTPGVQGPTENNKILVAQLTTAGDLSFELNIEVELGDGTVIKYVATDTLLMSDETANGLLVYPPVCGCTDPNFLEYDPSAGCDDGSCVTPIVLGCLDTLACNYDPDANFHVGVLCCYGPLDCNGLDWTLVCPDLGVPGIKGGDPMVVFPNPMHDHLTIQFADGSHHEAILSLSDMLGRTVRTELINGSQDNIQLDVDDLEDGIYLLHVEISGVRMIQRVVKGR